MKRFLSLAVALLLLSATTSPKLSERQRAMHALNRLSFGARPGDVDRVLETGVDAWIDRQLHPESIADRDLQTRLAQYQTLSMSDEAIVQKFYMPIVEARRAKKEKQGDEDFVREMR